MIRSIKLQLVLLSTAILLSGSKASVYSTPLASVIYVSPTGADSNEGTSISSPYQTLERARTAARDSSTKRICLLGGSYVRTSSLLLDKFDEGETWSSCSKEPAILDGDKKVNVGIAIRSRNITIRGLTVRQYTNTGILAQFSSGIVVDANRIEHIASDGWNQGGIVFLNGAENIRVMHNLIEDVGYDGILAANNESDRLKNLYIEYNEVYNTCRVVSDCGAIHANDRGHTATGITVKGNVIGNSSVPASKTEAIYLDDLLSNVLVSENIVYGKITNALQIHGGDHNIIENNIFDLSEASGFAVYDEDGPKRPDYGMRGNVIRCNLIYSISQSPPQLWMLTIDRRDDLPHVSSNFYRPNTGTFYRYSRPRDPHSVTGDPEFADPSKRDHNTTLIPSGCGASPG